jgi:hypothetical protein
MQRKITPKSKDVKETSNYSKYQEYTKSEEKIPRRPLSPTAYPEKKGN